MAEFVCQALEKDGFPRPDGMGYRTWVAQNIAHIKTEARTFKAEAPKNTRDLGKSMPGRVVYVASKDKKRQPTQQVITYEQANADEFLSSFAWRQLRWRVIQHYGARCMCCGATPEHGVVMNVDHIKPRRKRPDLALDFDNLQVLCEACNHGKGNDEADYRPADESIDPEVASFIRSIARGE